jgi:hypothetical protein
MHVVTASGGGGKGPLNPHKVAVTVRVTENTKLSHRDHE